MKNVKFYYLILFHHNYCIVHKTITKGHFRKAAKCLKILAAPILHKIFFHKNHRHIGKIISSKNVGEVEEMFL